MPINIDHTNNLIVTDDGLLDFQFTGAITIPVGTTGQQPGSPVDGMLRFNSSTSEIEVYNSGWDSIHGDVIKTGTPENNQVAVWTADGVIEGTDTLVLAGSDLGIGQVSPQGKIHATSNSYTHSWGYTSDMELIVERNSTTTTWINATNDGGIGQILFADNADVNPGGVIYDHNINTLFFRANNNQEMIWTGSSLQVNSPAGITRGVFASRGGFYDWSSNGAGGYAGFTTALSTGGAEFQAYSGGTGTNTFVDFDSPEITTAAFDVRFFRGTNTSGAPTVTMFNADGTGGWHHRFRRDLAFLSTQNGGTVIIGSQNSAIATLDVREETDASLSHMLQRWQVDCGATTSTLELIGPAADATTSPFTFNTLRALTFQTDGIDRLNIDFAGVITIGSTTPTLEVGDATTVTGAAEIIIGANRTGTGTSNLDLKGNQADDYGLRIIRATDETSSIRHAGTGVFAILTEDAAEIQFRTQLTTSMVIDVNGLIGIGTAPNPVVSLDIFATDAIGLPVGTTGERPTPGVGMIRYNSTLGTFEGYTGAWDDLLATGSGDVTKVGTPVNDQVGVWTGDGTLEGDVDLTFDGTNLTVGVPVGADQGNIRTDGGGIYDWATNDGGGYAGFRTLFSTGSMTIEAHSGGTDTDTFIYMDARDITTADFDVRFFRNTNTSGIKHSTWFVGDGTVNWNHRFVSQKVFLATKGDVGSRVIIGATDTPTATLDLREPEEGSLDVRMLRLVADLGTNQTSLHIFSPPADTITSPWTFDTENAIEFQIDSTARLNIHDSGRIGISEDTPTVSLHITATDAIQLPIGTTAQQPTSATGMFRYNTTIGALEQYSSEWRQLLNADNQKNYYIQSGSGEQYFLLGTIRASSSTDGFLNIKVMQSGDFGNNSPGYLEVQVKQRNGTVTMFANRVGAEIADDCHIEVQTPDSSVTINVYLVVDDFARHPIELYHSDNVTNISFGDPGGIADPGDAVLANSDNFIITTADHDGTSAFFGIGTATPATTLELVSATPIISLNDTDVNGIMNIEQVGNEMRIMVDPGNVDAGSEFRVYMDNILRFRMDSGGDLTIGASGDTDRALRIIGTDAIRIPVGTTGEQPASPEAGDLRYNTSDATFEGYTSSWQDLLAGGPGGSVTTSDTAPGGASDGDLWFDENDGTLNVFYDDGSSSQWVTASGPPGISIATGGGTDRIFWENDQTVTSNYTITNAKNAMSAGPIVINSGVTVTVGAGENWTIV